MKSPFLTVESFLQHAALQLRDVFDLIDNGSVVPLLFTAGLFIWLGQTCVASHATRRRAGEACGVIVLIAYLTYAYVGADSSAYFHAPGFSSSQELAHAAFRSVIAGALTLGLVWILAGPLAFFFRAVFWPYRFASRQFDAHVARRRQRRQERLNAKRRRQEKKEYDRNAPERARRQRAREAEEKRDTRIRRIKKRLRLELTLLYSQRRPHVADKVAPSDFDALLRDYLDAADTRAVAEERANMITDVLNACGPEHGPNRQYGSIEEIVLDFTDRKADLAKLPCDAATIDTLHALLAAQEQKTIMRFLER